MLKFESVNYRYNRKQDSAGVFDLSFEVKLGEIVALVGESGAGKSTICKLATGLYKPSSGRVTLPPQPHAVQMIFQSSSLSLSPHLSVFEIVAEGLRIQKMPAAEVSVRVYKALEDVGLGESFANRYASDLSGGQKQRVNIARALVLKPPVIIADEPVSALDVSVQAQICNVLKPQVKTLGCAMLLVLHDLVLAEYMADRVVVLKEGRIIEQASTANLFASPQAQYTQTLLAANGY